VIKVTVAMLAFRRNDELRRNLPNLLEEVERTVTAGERGVLAEVVLIDNDPQGSARAVVEELDHPRLRHVVEPRPGIAFGRNRALEESVEADALVFIDDDERPLGGWLSALLTLWISSGAAAVGGKVLSDFEEEPDSWLTSGRYFVRRSMPTGTEIAACATNNLLLDRRALERLGLRFDESLGLGGGEDTLFTTRLTRAGRRMVWCEEAVVVEHVPADRLRRTWVRQRSISHGNTLAKVSLRLASTRAARATSVGHLVLGGAVRLAVGGARRGLGSLLRQEVHAARGARSFWRGSGMLAGVFGVEYSEYRTRHLPRFLDGLADGGSVRRGPASPGRTVERAHQAPAVPLAAEQRSHRAPRGPQQTELLGSNHAQDVP